MIDAAPRFQDAVEAECSGASRDGDASAQASRAEIAGQQAGFPGLAVAIQVS